MSRKRTEVIDHETGEVMTTIDPAARRIHELYGEFRTMVCGALGRALEIGKVLEGKRAECGGNGKKGMGFKAWIADCLPFKRQQAYRYLSLWLKFGPCTDIVTRSIDHRAAEKFLPQSIPEEAIEEAIDRATGGEHINEEIAKEIIAKHKPESKEPSFDAKSEAEHLSHYINDLMRRCPAEHIEYVFKCLVETTDILRKSHADI